jgi:hypothetical protein
MNSIQRGKREGKFVISHAELVIQFTPRLKLYAFFAPRLALPTDYCFLVFLSKAIAYFSNHFLAKT